MVSRCSVLGHSLGEPSTEEETEEQNGQRIKKVRSVRTCKHCNEKEVVSENTKVHTITNGDDEESENPAESSPDEATEQLTPPSPGSFGPEPYDSESPRTVPDGGTRDIETDDDAVFIDDGPSEDEEPPRPDAPSDAGDGQSDSAASETSGSNSSFSSDTHGHAVDSTADDAVFLSNDSVDEDSESTSTDSTLSELEPADGDQGVIIMDRPEKDDSVTESSDTDDSTDLGVVQGDTDGPTIECTICDQILAVEETPLRPGDSCPADGCTGWLSEEE